MRSRFSIEAVIVTAAAALFAVVGGFLYFIVNDNASRAADEAFDRVLGAAALTIADTVAFENGAVTVDIPYAAFAILGTSRLNRIFYRVVAPDRTLVTGSPVLALDMPPATGPELRFAHGRMQGEAIRIAAVGRYRSDAVTGEAGWIEVLVAETREARDQLAGQLAVEATIPAALVAFFAFLLIWTGIRFAFSPLRSVERSLRARSSSDLTPIGGPVPREIEALVITLNEFMSRLGSTLEGLRRVTSDAAHQLRTPLAAIRAQSEIALEDTDPQETRRRLKRINDNAVNASMLASRWLTDATLLHNLKTRKTEPVDLARQVREAIGRLEAEGMFREQLAMLERDLPQEPVIVLADPVSLIEMIRNLIENAFVHAPGPAAVKLARDGPNARLEVFDSGPGIPPERREAVFERFERNTSARPGTGLGLAIARDVAEASGGRIELSDNGKRGLRVSVTLPVHESPASAAQGKRKRKRLRARGTPLALAFLAAAILAPLQDAAAQAADRRVVIASTISPERFAPVLDELARLFPEAELAYQQARSPEIAARVRARTGDEPGIVILPSPDIGVSLTNDGLAARLGLASVPSERHWRDELYAVAYDPAVFAFREQSAGNMAIPQSRLELAQLLEQASTPLLRRIGIVNVGIDSVSYSLAAQDSLRSPLYWRLARAFGAAQARIRDTSEELIAAIANGEIDIAYNVPLSAIVAYGTDRGVGYLRPQDYVAAVPWVAFAPKSQFRPVNREIIAVLTDESFRPTLSLAIGGLVSGSDPTQANVQTPDLGPELLVFLDSIKRGTFLDTWFQLVTSP